MVAVTASALHQLIEAQARRTPDAPRSRSRASG